MLTSLSDALIEGGETVVATLNAVTGGGTIGTSKAATATIVDRTALYSVSGVPSVDEGGNLVFTISRSVDNGAQTVSYSLGGTATSGLDYIAPAGTVSFAPLEMNKQVVLAVSRDWLNEGNETATLSLTSVTEHGAVISSTAVTTTIVDTTPLPLPVSGKAVTFWSGSSYDDTFVGDDRNNSLNGQGGVDTLSGGKGDDTYVVEYHGDIVIELAGEGIDTVESWSKTSYALSANVENLKLLGAYQYGFGNELANRIVGGSSTDYIDGRAGDDWLIGGADNDVLTGGDGIDRAVFSGTFANYDFRWLGSTLEVSHRNGGVDGTDQLIGVELLDFADTVVDRSTAAPITKGDVASGTEDHTLTIDVLANDISLVSENDLKFERFAGGLASLWDIVAITSDGKGTITLGPDNKLLFTPGAGYDFLGEGQFYNTSFVYRVASNTGQTSSATVQLTLTGRNDAPMDITLINPGVSENAPGGTVVASLVAVDPDASDKPTFALITGDGLNDADNALVTIIGDRLQVSAGANIDFETNPTLDIKLQVTDSNGLKHTKLLNIAVSDVNDTLVGGYIVDKTYSEGYSYGRSYDSWSGEVTEFYYEIGTSENSTSPDWIAHGDALVQKYSDSYYSVGSSQSTSVTKWAYVQETQGVIEIPLESNSNVSEARLSLQAVNRDTPMDLAFFVYAGDGRITNADWSTGILAATANVASNSNGIIEIELNASAVNAVLSSGTHLGINVRANGSPVPDDNWYEFIPTGISFQTSSASLELFV